MVPAWEQRCGATCSFASGPRGLNAALGQGAPKNPEKSRFRAIYDEIGGETADISDSRHNLAGSRRPAQAAVEHVLAEME